MSYYTKYESENDLLWEIKSEEVDAMPIQKVCDKLCEMTGQDYISVKSESETREILTEKLFNSILEDKNGYDRNEDY